MLRHCVNWLIYSLKLWVTNIFQNLSKMELINIHQASVHLKGEYQHHDKHKSSVRQVEQASIKQKQSEQASVVEDSNSRIYKNKGNKIKDKRQ